MRDALAASDAFDLIVHLGDGVRDGNTVAEEFCIPFYGICGNEDFGADYPEKYILNINEWVFCFIHGHQFDINPYQSEDVWEKNFNDLYDFWPCIFFL